MATEKVSAMAALAAANVATDDLLMVVDTSATESKKITMADVRTYTNDGFTASRAVEIDADGNIVASDVTATELSLLDGRTGTLVTTGETQTLTNKTLTSPDVNGGTIDNATIGGATPATGSFTDLNASGDTDLAGVSATGFTIGDTSYGGIVRTYEVGSGVAPGSSSAFDIDFTAINALSTGFAVIGCILRVDNAMAQTWTAAYAGAGLSQTISGAGTAAALNTKIYTCFDINSASNIATLGTAFKITVTADTGNFDAGDKVTAVVFYEYFNTIPNVGV